MSYLESSTQNMSAADLRSASVEKLRAKKRRVRYRNTNMALIGSPINYFEPYYPAEDQPPHQNYLWNDRNKFKMPPRVNGRTCLCHACHTTSLYRRDGSSKKFQGEDVCITHVQPEDFGEVDSVYDFAAEKVRDKALSGITYSYDRPTGPSHGSQILSQALGAAIDRMENKQLEKLVRDEYDVIQTEDSSSDDEFELI